MGRAGKSDTHLRQAPLMTVITEAAEPHENRGKEIHYTHDPKAGDIAEQPLILRMPEIIHGLRNMIQNAVDFAETHIWVETHWTDEKISIRILDDGDGFPPHLLGRIGDPFMKRRRQTTDKEARPGYDGMGLGLFIAKTLLERTGAEINFANGRDPFSAQYGGQIGFGAIVEVVWPRARIDARVNTQAVGRNERITA